MLMRSVLPIAAIALAVGAVSGCSTQESPSAQVRPAQMSQLSECDLLARQVQQRMPTAMATRVGGLSHAQDDLREAQGLCRSGQEEEGATMMRGILDYMNEGQ
jgi:hypothetical protein